MILRARHVVPMDRDPIENGAVVVEKNKIGEVGRWPEIRAGASGDVVDLGECALMPGLINAHCHLDYTALRGTIPRQESFTKWIETINARKTALTPPDYLRSIAEGFAEAAAFGTTTVANLEAFPELLSRMARPPLRTWWFAEMIDVRAQVSASETGEEIRRSFERDGDWLGGLGLAPHAPYTASAGLYAEAAQMARGRNFRMTTHLAESREERQMFQEASGPLFEFMERLGRGMDDCGTGTPVSLFLDLKMADERWIIAHLNELIEEDFARLTTAWKFHVVHCPRSHSYFRHTPFRLKDLRKIGFNICVGTDSLASNENLSLFAELRQLSNVEPTLSPQQLFEMVTLNGAAALGQTDTLGRIRPGFTADLIAVPVSSADAQLFESLLDFTGKIPWMMINGEARERV